jgi:hypothetical protein
VVSVGPRYFWSFLVLFFQQPVRTFGNSKVSDGRMLLLLSAGRV